MMFTKKFEYAMVFLECLTDKPKRVEDIAESCNIDYNYLQQISRRLNCDGLIEVKRGPKGGVFKTKEVSAWKVFQSLEGKNLSTIKNKTLNNLFKDVQKAFERN